MDGDSGSAIQDFLSGKERDDPQVALAIKSQQAFVRKLIYTALETLEEREKIIIKDRFLADPTLKFREVGEELGISKERVRQLQMKALEKLRAFIKEQMNGEAKELFQ